MFYSSKAKTKKTSRSLTYYHPYNSQKSLAVGNIATVPIHYLTVPTDSACPR